MSRFFPLLVAVCAFAFVACDRDARFGRCDADRCYVCHRDQADHCEPVPNPTCASATDCSLGETCTAWGCAPGCNYDGNCAAGFFCSDRGVCTPSGVDPDAPGEGTPDGGGLPTGCSTDAQCGAGRACEEGRCVDVEAPLACGVSAPRCTSDAQCGAGRTCGTGACRARCGGAVACPRGQACALEGYCIDAAPSPARCLWDVDCGAGARCVNASCRPLCATDSQCAALEWCSAGLCRVDERPR